MTSSISSLPKFTVRTKILIMVLAIAIIALVITGYMALFTFGAMAKSAESDSLSLGREVLNETTDALQASARAGLVQMARDHAEIIHETFMDTETELGLMAVQAATLQENPPVQSVIPSRDRDHPPADPFAAVAYTFSPGVSFPEDSTELRRTAGMDDLLKGTYDEDTNLTAVYLATDSGILRSYPWSVPEPRGYDHRTRAWFTGAKSTPGIYWSDPYVDATGEGLVVTSSTAVPAGTGTWVIAADVSVDVINSAFLNRTLGGRGYTVLLDSRGNIISRPGLGSGNLSWDRPFPRENGFEETDPALVSLTRNMTAGRTGVEMVRFGGRESYVAYAPVQSMNWSLAISLPVDEVTAPLRAVQARIMISTREAESSIADTSNRIMLVFSALLCALIIIVAGLAWYLSRLITRPVDVLKNAALAVGHGDLEYRVDLKTGDEFEDLATSFNTMSADLKRNIDDLKRTTAEKERYAKEMEIAKEIQETILPESVPSIPGFEICATAIPAMEIGGDLYDFIPMPSGRWGFVIADVSGKGVSAALYMALCRTLIRVSGSTRDQPGEAMMEANRLIYEDGRSSMFITVFYGVLDPVERTFSYVNAGHNPPLLLRGNPPAARAIPGKGVALGVIGDISIAPQVLRLEPGDLLVLFTDGITEAFNEQDEYFGEERFKEFVARHRDLPVREIMDGLIAEIRRFSGTRPQSDDITIIMIRVV